jgi:glycerol-3-phosphate acyltransferase PlsY
MKRIIHRSAAILWPAFLVAAVLEILVFAFVDPSSLHSLSGQALTLSDTAVYSIAFFVFWGCISAACALTVLLERGADDINRLQTPR